ncbi:hypothetical protein [Microcella frigidaquae]|uniref:Uncharacterized protein n=1 Tax=Microcella frigidaquae TaxID=424758 RepID=A0A840X968_9MICO|nr:hypothetical protein [Microcella frigidaquae]MBB5617635.1 hypothetical protein [Microcella frigidaquae]NHN45840.1 hypothetical protein [Microcella frigidaquae]
MSEVRVVSAEVVLSRTTVPHSLAERGIDTSRGMNESQIAQAAEFYGRGLSSASIAIQLGLENHTILNALQIRAVVIRPSAARRELRNEEGST